MIAAASSFFFGTVCECARAACGHVRHLVQAVLGDAPNEEA